MLLQVLKYLLAGVFVWFIGTVFLGSSEGFSNRSEPAQLVVLELETRLNSDGRTVYRPVLALEAAQPPRPRYAGNHWVASKPHQAGDVISGRYDPETGEMRSDEMLASSGWLGRVARIVGILIALQSIALLFGIPEQWLPLRVRVGRRRRSSLAYWQTPR